MSASELAIVEQSDAVLLILDRKQSFFSAPQKILSQSALTFLCHAILQLENPNHVCKVCQFVYHGFSAPILGHLTLPYHTVDRPNRRQPSQHVHAHVRKYVQSLTPSVVLQIFQEIEQPPLVINIWYADFFINITLNKSHVLSIYYNLFYNFSRNVQRQLFVISWQPAVHLHNLLPSQHQESRL